MKIISNIKPNKAIITSLMVMLTSLATYAQQATDTVILNAGQSKIMFLINDHADIKKMQDYDLNKILDQLGYELTGDSTLIRQNGTVASDTIITVAEKSNNDSSSQVDEVSDDDNKKLKIMHSFNIDLGMNNFLSDGKFPDESNELYAVKPFGSWYVGLSSVIKSHITGPLYVEWGGGVSWYNFKFENKNTRLEDTDNGITFFEVTDPEVEFKKSKLTVAYVQASVVPMLDFGRPKFYSSNSFNVTNDKHNRAHFRIGFGGYLGYKIDSYTKTVIDNGDKEKKRNHDNFHLENIRYGARLQMGYKGTDIFFNYDLNELFSEGNGPKLNAFSFGIIL